MTFTSDPEGFAQWARMRYTMTEDEAPVTDVTADDPPEDGDDAKTEGTDDQEDVPLLVNDAAPEDNEGEP